MDIRLYRFFFDNLVIHTLQISKRFKVVNKVVNLNVLKKPCFTMFSSKMS